MGRRLELRPSHGVEIPHSVRNPIVMKNAGKDNFRSGIRLRPLLLVVSAPSGGGKTTLCRHLLGACPKMRYSISCTTRAPRGTEANGRAYHFLTQTQFSERVRRGDFLEYARVHDHFYGTPRAGVESALRNGYDIVLDIDIQGARMLRDTLTGLPADDPVRRAYVDVFVEPPSLQALEKRLRARGQDEEAVIARRLRNAVAELAAAHEYDYRIVNDDLEKAADTLRSIVVAEHHRNLDGKEQA